MLAAEGGHREICALLADRGADLNRTDNVSYSNSYSAACFDRMVPFMSACFCFDQGGKTALMYASAGGNQEICAVLVERGADTNASDNVSCSNS